MHIYLDLNDMVFGDCLSWSTKREPGIVWFAAWEKLILGGSVVVLWLVDDADSIRLGFLGGVDRLVVRLRNRLPKKGQKGIEHRTVQLSTPGVGPLMDCPMHCAHNLWNTVATRMRPNERDA